MSIATGATILEKYRVLRLLGQGATANVWLAEEINFGNRQVAIKEPRPDLLTADLELVRARYQREVRVCAELIKQHTPHIVSALTAEPYSDGLLLVLTYMPGGDMADLLKRQSKGLPVEQVVGVAKNLLSALAAVHAHPWEIVHRDVKPGNVLFDAVGGAFLGDFGFAQYTSASQDLSKLRGDILVGTPAYAAPEQATATGYLTPAADIYATGCILFEALTGKRYKGRVAPGTPPSQLRAEVPAWLDSLVVKALAEQAWERWDNCEEMLEVIESPPGAQTQSTADQASSISVPRSDAPPAQPHKTPATMPPDKQPSFLQRLFGASSAKPIVIVEENGPPYNLRPDKQIFGLHGLVQAAQERPIDVMWHMRKETFELWLTAVGQPQLAQLVAKMKDVPPGSTPYYLKQLLDASKIRHGYTPHPPLDLDLVQIPAGPFLKGSNPAVDRLTYFDEQPQSRVDRPAYYIARYPVTVELFADFVKSTGYVTTAEAQASGNQPPQVWWRHPCGLGSDVEMKANHPVTCVSIYDAQAFCVWADVRLPQEDEWEKAARGVDGRIYPWGNHPPSLRQINFGDFYSDTTPVDIHPMGASPFAVFDMAGNVWEWTETICHWHPMFAWLLLDQYHKLRSSPSEARMFAALRMLHGGSYKSHIVDTRCAYRFWCFQHDYRAPYVGFRVVFQPFQGDPNQPPTYRQQSSMFYKEPPIYWGFNDRSGLDHFKKKFVEEDVSRMLNSTKLNVDQFSQLVDTLRIELDGFGANQIEMIDGAIDRTKSLRGKLIDFLQDPAGEYKLNLEDALKLYGFLLKLVQAPW